MIALISDGQGDPIRCTFGGGLLNKEDPVVSLIVDLRTRRVCAVLSGMLDDGSAHRSGGLAFLPPGFALTPLIAPEIKTDFNVEKIRLWCRPLLIAEALAAQNN